MTPEQRNRTFHGVPESLYQALRLAYESARRNGRTYYVQRIDRANGVTYLITTSQPPTFPHWEYWPTSRNGASGREVFTIETGPVVTA